jgi:putative transposase
MSTQRFSTGKQFVWHGVAYQVKRLLAEGMISVENVQTAEVQVIPFLELAEALFAGELDFVVPDKGEGAQNHPRPANLSDYPLHLRHLAEYRLSVIQPLLAIDSSKRTRSDVATRVAEIQKSEQADQASPKNAVSVASIYRWIRAYTESGNDIRALVGNSRRQGGKNSTRLEGEVEAIIRAVIEDRYYVSEQVTMDDIYLETLLRIAEENQTRPEQEKLSAPSRATVWRRIDALDEEEKLVAKRGKRAARQELTQYGQMDYPTMALERAEIDHTPLDIIVVDAQDNLPLGRPTFTFCMDTATRQPLGFYIGFDPPSYLTVMQCLHHAILTKGDVRTRYGTEHDWVACGIPFTLVVDNGKEFIGTDLQEACLSLGIELVQMPVRMPHFKAAVERMFGTLNTGLLHTLPGTTFSTPNQRGEYRSEQEACITLQELDRAFHIFLLDVYAESFHRGLGDIPARRWEAITQSGFFPRLPASVQDLKILLGRVARRKISPAGIQFLKLRYNSPALAPLRHSLGDTKAKVKYDPADLGCIYVYDPKAEAYVEVECLNKDYAQGLSLWKHRVICNLARQESNDVDLLALARAKRKIQQIVQESRSSKRIRSRSRVARWEAGGNSAGQTSQVTTPDPGQAPPLLPGPQPDPSDSAPELAMDLEDLEREGWSAGYDLPNTHR